MKPIFVYSDAELTPNYIRTDTGTDQPLEPDEAQLWALLGGFDDDMEPETHALRLKLSLCTRTCQPHMPCPWDASRELCLYHAKLSLIPAACQV